LAAIRASYLHRGCRQAYPQTGANHRIANEARAANPFCFPAMPALVAASMTLGARIALKTWMAGTQPGHDASIKHRLTLVATLWLLA
jgi:hypothetical protein